MARFPTYDEYRDRPEKGIQRCDDLLKKHPKDAQLLLTKLQLSASLFNHEVVEQVLTQLSSIQPPIQDLVEIGSIEEVLVEMQSNTYPVPLTAGPGVAKLWDNALKATSNTNYKLDLQSLRFSRAILDSRLIDAQQSLIQLKALLPKKRVFYMAHAIVTQMLSSRKDDLQSRLALSLARKATIENFDEDKSLDCRVPGQIFAIQDSIKDLESIKGRPFEGSKQVFEARRTSAPPKANGEPSLGLKVDAAAVPTKEWLLAEISSLKQDFSTLVNLEHGADALEKFVANAVALYQTCMKSASLRNFRSRADVIFLAISSLVRLWEIKHDATYLLQAAFVGEQLLKDSPNIHEAKVILVYIYMRLELGYLAMKHWDSLSIKEVQFDTFGHAFLTRLSVTHPHSFKDRKLREADPLRLTTQALSVYRRCEEKLAETHADVLNHGQTGMILDLHALRESLRLSLTRRILSLEQRRCLRLSNRSLDEKAIHLHTRLTAAWLDTKDTRDFSAAFNYGLHVERTLHALDDAKTWILFNLAADSLWCLLHGSVPAVKDTKELLRELDGVSTQGSLTDQEYLVGCLAHRLLRVIFDSTQSGDRSDIDIGYIEADIERLGIGEMIGTASTLPLQIQHVYLYIDALRLISAFCKFTEQKKILSNDKAKRLRQTAEDEFRELQKYARIRLADVKVSNYRDVVESSHGRPASQSLVALAKDDLDDFCATVADAVKDAWSGVVLFKCT